MLDKGDIVVIYGNPVYEGKRMTLLSKPLDNVRLEVTYTDENVQVDYRVITLNKDLLVLKVK